MKKGNKVGSWAFLVGFILAVLVGLLGDVSSNAAMLAILVLIGLIVGLLNIADAEAHSFLLSGAVLIIASSMGANIMDGVPILNSVLKALLALFVPATIIVAIRNVFTMARN